MLKRAAGIEKASTEACVAELSVKHVYEIARIKHGDPLMSRLPLRSVFRMVAASAISYGFRII